MCYVNAIQSSSHDELHIKCTKKTIHQQSLFKQLTELTIRVTDICSLSRLADYNVEFDAICSVKTIELVRCALLEQMGRCRLEKTGGVRLGTKRPHQHLREFRNWIDSDQLKEKYVQQYS
jgi:hypothetical protein